MVVNAVKVNVRTSCFPHVTFREFFRALGKFSRFKRSLKYKRNLSINHPGRQEAQAQFLRGLQSLL